MPGRSTHLVVAAHPWSPGGRSSAQPACLAQPGIPADRCAREIVRFLKALPGALAAADRQPVGRAHGSVIANTYAAGDTDTAWI